MHAHLHAWMCLVNIKAWPGQPIFWGCFGLDCISCLDIRCFTHDFVSRIRKAFPSGAACQYFSWELSQKFQLTLTSHQWLQMPRRWRLRWHLLPLISTLGFCWYGPDLVPQSRVSPVLSCAKRVRKRVSATDRLRGINTGWVDQWVCVQEGGFLRVLLKNPWRSSWMKWMSWSENQWQA